MGIKRTFIKNTSFNIGSYIYLVIASIISIPILVNSLGIRTFGFYTLITSILPILSVFDFGMSQAAIRNLSLPGANEDDKTKTWQTSFYFFLITGILLFLTVIGIFQLYIYRLPTISNIIGNSSLPLMFIVATTVLLNHLNAHFMTISQARQRYDIFSLYSFIAGTANTLLAAIISLIKPDLSLIFFVRLVGIIITLLIMWIYSRKHFPAVNFPKFHPEQFKKMISFGLRSFAGRVFSIIEAYGLNFILASFIALQAVTYFSIPQSLIIKAAGGISMLTLSLFPLSTSLLTKENFFKLKKLIAWLQVGIIGLGVSAIMVILIVGKPLLLLWLRDAELVNNIYPILQILSIQLFLVSLTPMPTAVLESMNFPAIPSFFAFLTVMIEFSLLFFLLPRFGVNGAAMALSASVMITVPAFLLVFFNRFRKFEQKLYAPKT
ncbi:oligosaccharide flippase family protein [Candidatus Curtissbacteria bacterium]|nr:oligosaccharide flippase family protein [Candidatus Curtissbacteria bacterium]